MNERLQALRDARLLADAVADYVTPTAKAAYRPRYDHIGAMLADAVLQTGLNYQHVVLPRVRRILADYEEARSLAGLKRVLARVGPRSFLDWSHHEKPQRLLELVDLFDSADLQSVDDFAAWFAGGGDQQLVQIRGVGPKTCDYMGLISGESCVPVDRHMWRLLDEVGARPTGYEQASWALNYASDLLGVERAVFDRTIWSALSVSNGGSQHRTVPARSGE